MATINYIEGLGEVMANLRGREIALGVNCSRGLLLAGRHLLKESQKLVPVEHGDLKDSGFVSLSNKGFYTQVEVGYTSPYAIWVHENVGMKLKGQPRPSGIGNYWDPNGRPKFLEEPSRRLRPALLAIIARECAV